jgi:hypothetical protein
MFAQSTGIDDKMSISPERKKAAQRFVVFGMATSLATANLAGNKLIELNQIAVNNAATGLDDYLIHAESRLPLKDVIAPYAKELSKIKKMIYPDKKFPRNQSEMALAALDASHMMNKVNQQSLQDAVDEIEGRPRKGAGADDESVTDDDGGKPTGPPAGLDVGGNDDAEQEGDEDIGGEQSAVEGNNVPEVQPDEEGDTVAEGEDDGAEEVTGENDVDGAGVGGEEDEEGHPEPETEENVGEPTEADFVQPDDDTVDNVGQEEQGPEPVPGEDDEDVDTGPPDVGFSDDEQKPDDDAGENNDQKPEPVPGEDGEDVDTAPPDSEENPDRKGAKDYDPNAADLYDS